MAIEKYFIEQGDKATSDDLADVVLSGAVQNEVLVRDGSSQWVNQLLNTASLEDNSVTFGKQATLVQGRLIGRGGASGTGIPELISIGSGLDLAGTVLSAIGGSANAVTEDINQSSHGFVVGDVLDHNGTIFTKAQADDEATSDVLGVVSVNTDSNNFEITYSGKITTLSGLTGGDQYFLSTSVAGAATNTEPSQGSIIKPVFYAISATVAIVHPQRGIQIAADAGGGPDIQIFTSSGTWTKPAGVSLVYVIAFGAGGGAGGGATDHTGGTGSDGRAAGGGGGGAGARHERLFIAAQLGATEDYVVGTGGTGGVGASSNLTDGNVGTVGTLSSFGTTPMMVAGGGGEGAAGASGSTVANSGGGGGTAGSASGTIGGEPQVNGVNTNQIAGSGGPGSGGPANNAEWGGASGGAGSTGGGVDGGSSINSAGGGGGGGSMDHPGQNAGGEGGTSGQYVAGGGGAAGTAGNPPTVGGNGAVGTNGYGGSGGGGGGSTTTNGTIGAAGGDGAVVGGGGGGGGANKRDANAGTGGDGGRGEVRVYSW